MNVKNTHSTFSLLVLFPDSILQSRAGLREEEGQLQSSGKLFGHHPPILSGRQRWTVKVGRGTISWSSVVGSLPFKKFTCELGTATCTWNLTPYQKPLRPHNKSAQLKLAALKDQDHKMEETNTFSSHSVTMMLLTWRLSTRGQSTLWRQYKARWKENFLWWHQGTVQ